MQKLVAEEHDHPKAIGAIDESGNPKNSKHTACVDHQSCDNTGIIDNCVVAVHTSYLVGDFYCLLDSDLFMPKSWATICPDVKRHTFPMALSFVRKPELRWGK